MQWLWKGPKDGGITQSMIHKFLQDKFQFVLYYGLGLEVPHEISKEIIWGNVIHKGLEILIRNPKPMSEFTADDWKEIDKAIDKEANLEINTPPGTAESVKQMIRLYDDKYKIGRRFVTEKEFEFTHHTGINEVTLMGKIDAVTEDSNELLGEHKSRKKHDKVQLRKELPFDVQLNLYSRAAGTFDYVYDVFVVPDFQFQVPSRRTGEHYSQYWKRLYTTHRGNGYPIKDNQFAWIDQIKDKLTEESIEFCFKTTINPIVDEICELYDYCQNPSFDPFNPDCYNKTFYRKPIRMFEPMNTSNFKSDYWPLLVGQLDKNSLVPVSKLFKELEIGD